MIAHRCKFENIENPFTKEAVERIYHVSGGVPRLVLKICAFSYHIMELENLVEITPEFIEMSQPEVLIPSEPTPRSKSIRNKAATAKGRK